MADKIGTQTGIEASRLQLLKLGLSAVGFNKLLGKPGQDYGFGPVEGTVTKLVSGHNEHEDRIAKLEQEVRSRPFV